MIVNVVGLAIDVTNFPLRDKIRLSAPTKKSMSMRDWPACNCLSQLCCYPTVQKAEVTKISHLMNAALTIAPFSAANWILSFLMERIDKRQAS